MALYDASGRLVRTIATGSYVAGVHETTWNGRDNRGDIVTTGIYFLRVINAGQVMTHNIVVVR